MHGYSQYLFRRVWAVTRKNNSSVGTRVAGAYKSIVFGTKSESAMEVVPAEYHCYARVAANCGKQNHGCSIYGYFGRVPV